MNNTEKKYSLIQYFLWVIAGSEIPILKECPTDYNKHAAVGGMILATTLFAFCAGGYAAYFFTNDGFSAFAFGLLWAFLILSIDRCLVVTLKKNPTKKNSFIIPFSGRLILSLIIAFMVSIPLELFIFRDNIQANKIEYQIAKQSKIREGVENITRIGDKITERDNLTISTNTLRDEKSSLHSKLNALKNEMKALEYKRNTPESSIYKNALEKRNRYSKDYNFIQSKLNNSELSYNERFELEKERDRYKRLKDDENNILSEEKKKWREIWDLKYEQKQLELKKLNTEFTEVDENLKQYQEKLTIAQNNVSIASAESDTLTNNQGKILKTIENGFINQFQILEFAAHKKDIDGNYADLELFVFLWLIRLLFLMIELLPTIVKMTSPIGTYDWAIYHKENQFAAALNMNSQAYIDHQNQLVQIRNEAEQDILREKLRLENDLKKRLLNEIAFAQEDIAKKMIRRFHEDGTKYNKKIDLNI